MKLLITGLFLATFLISCKEKAADSTEQKAERTARAAADSFSQYEIMGLTIDLPASPTSQPLELPAQVKQVMESMEVYQLSLSAGKVMLSHMVYKIPEVNLDGAAAGGIAQVRDNPKATDFTSSTEEVIVDGLAGRQVHMSLKQDGHPLNQHSLIFARGNELWQIQVIALGEGDQEDLEKLRDRIFDSVELPK
ncbi:hypothetical protein [Luteolibacter sp. AS25]|uniref:hypothetical protein n=1 Tax=Luteolibacter sp. AS25 TaxID=3135776 RepID=UPI00398AB24F